MKNVSNKYKNAVDNDRVIYTRLSGQLVTPSATYNISEENVIPNTLSINKKCVDSSNFNYGSVITGEMNISLLLPEVDRYTLYGGTITLSYFLKFQDNTEEEIDLGTWNIDSPTRTKKLVALKCYDNMLLFDKALEENTSGTPYELLALACSTCGVELANTQADIGTMPNSEQNYIQNMELVGTYRDMIRYIASILCCYAVIDEQGRLLLKRFGKTPVKEVADKNVLSSTISDYMTSFGSVAVRFFANENFAPYQVSVGEGLTLNMGDNPIVQGADTIKHYVLNNIMDDLKDIIYTPVNIKMIGDPSLEVGDYITIAGVDTLITSLTWVYRSQCTLASAGANPKLQNVKSKTDKLASSMEGMMAKQEIEFMTFTNASDYEIQGDKQIITMNIATDEEGVVVMVATVPLEIDMDGNVTFTYRIDGQAIESITEYLERGTHIVSFNNYFNMEKDGRCTLSITASTGYFESDTRKQEAKIISLDRYARTGSYTETAIDTTIPSISIAKETIKCVVFGKCIVTEEMWDGTINIAEVMPDEYAFGAFGVLSDMAENIITNTQISKGDTINQKMPDVFTFGSFSVDGNWHDVPVIFRDFDGKWGTVIDYTWNHWLEYLWQDINTSTEGE